MKKERITAGFPAVLWKFFASVRLTIVVLLSLAVTSIIGTIIPQNASPEAYYHKYGAYFYKIFNLFDIFDMYHSWWFRVLVLTLVVNVIVCSVDRLSGTLKIVFAKIPSFNLSRFRKIPEKEEFTVDRTPEGLKKSYEPFVSKKFGYYRIEPTDGGLCIFAEKGRWTRLGVYIVHFSVILLLFGGLLGSVFGFSGYVKISEGDIVNAIRLKKTNRIQPLDFKIRCDDFNVSFYDSGAPKEYRSSLSIIQEGRVVLKKDIIVNAPLRYKGINIFQSSYGTAEPKQISLNLTSRETGLVYNRKVTIGEEIEIQEGLGKFVVKNFIPSFNFRGHTIGDALVGMLVQDDSEPVSVILPLRFPNFDKMRQGDVVISLADFTRRYYTGLQITKDPGVYVVYAGFIVMIIGFYITFFMSHQRCCIEMSKTGDKSSRVMVTGTSNKNKIGMQNTIKKISQRLELLSESSGL